MASLKRNLEATETDTTVRKSALRELEGKERLEQAKKRGETTAVRQMQSEVKELRRRQIEVENYVKDQHTMIRNRDARCRELVKVIKKFRDDKGAEALTSPRGAPS